VCSPASRAFPSFYVRKEETERQTGRKRERERERERERKREREREREGGRERESEGERGRERETGGRIIKEREEDGRERQRALWRGDATATPPQLLAEVSYDEGKQGEQRGRKEKETARNGRAYSRGTDR